MTNTLELRTAGVEYARQREALIAATGMDDDDECLRDTLEGITDLDELIVRAIREANRAKAMANAMTKIIKDNETRRERFLAKVEKIREAVALAMSDAGLNKIAAADVTLSLRRSKPVPKIIDADALPAWARFEKIVQSPNLNAIKDAYADDPAGFSVPGVVITNAAPILTIRSK